MAYTNGYDLSPVLTALKDRIGFRQPVGSGAPTLSSAVTTTGSGRYFQDFHALVTVENIKATMPSAPANDSALITYLGEIRQAAILRALNGVFPGPQVVDQPGPVSPFGSSDTLQTSSGRFVGFQIQVADSPDAAVQIDALQLYFDQAATFKIYLFKDGNPVRLWEQSVTTEANAIKEVVLTERILKRGRYFIGYFQDDLAGAKAYRDHADIRSSALFGVTPMQAPAIGAAALDQNEISYTGDLVGLNIELSSFRDLTTAIVKKASMFDELIGLTFAYQTIEQVIYSTRSNANERILKDQLDRVGIQLDLNGAAPISESPQVSGLRQRIDRELRTVRESFYPSPKAKTVGVC